MDMAPSSQPSCETRQLVDHPIMVDVMRVMLSRLLDQHGSRRGGSNPKLESAVSVVLGDPKLLPGLPTVLVQHNS
jgi:hypothetical protein